MHSVSKKQVRINLGEADQFPEHEWTRRKLLKVISAAGVGSAVFGRALRAQVAETGTVTEEMIRQAEWITGMEFSDQERELMLQRVSGNLDQYAELREVPLDPEVPPALAFDPAPWAGNVPRGSNGAVEISESAARRRPDSSEDLAFATVTELAALVRTRQVSSVELTRLYLDRLRRYDPVLHCVITYTDELALNQAEKADREIAAGRYRGPLHGIPWGAKDNLAVPGYRTTWGAMPYKDQVLSQKATVAARLEEAGAGTSGQAVERSLRWGTSGSGARQGTLGIQSEVPVAPPRARPRRRPRGWWGSPSGPRAGAASSGRAATAESPACDRPSDE